MKRCVIVGGAELNNYDRINSLLRKDDYVIYCDSGLNHMEHLSATPSLIIGDFDTHENPGLDIETIILPRAKDDIDTIFALKEALRRGCDEFIFVGTVGGRLDLTLANLGGLVMLHDMGIPALIICDDSELRIVGSEPVAVTDDCRFFSLLNITGIARGINITGAKFPLTNGEITTSYQYGTSNEVLPGQTATISVSEGMLLLITY